MVNPIFYHGKQRVKTNGMTGNGLNRRRHDFRCSCVAIQPPGNNLAPNILVCNNADNFIPVIRQQDRTNPFLGHQLGYLLNRGV